MGFFRDSRKTDQKPAVLDYEGAAARDGNCERRGPILKAFSADAGRLGSEVAFVSSVFNLPSPSLVAIPTRSLPARNRSTS